MLLTSADTQDTLDEVPTSIEPVDTVPQAIRLLDAAFFAEIELGREITARIHALERDLASATGISHEAPCIKVPGAGSERACIAAFAERCTRVAAQLLSTPLAPFTAELKVGHREFKLLLDQLADASHKADRTLYEAVLQACRPLALWSLLTAEHDPDAQRDRHEFASARTLLINLGFLRRLQRDAGTHSQLKEVRGKVEIKLSTSVSRNHAGKPILRSGVQIEETLTALGNILRAHGHEHHEAFHTKHSEHEGFCMWHEVTPRRRHDLGAGVELVEGIANFTLLLPKSAFELINLSIATHRDELMRIYRF